MLSILTCSNQKLSVYLIASIWSGSVYVMSDTATLFICACSVGSLISISLAARNCSHVHA